MNGSKKRIIENGKSKLVPVGYVTNQRKVFEKERAKAGSEQTRFYESGTWQKCRHYQLVMDLEKSANDYDEAPSVRGFISDKQPTAIKKAQLDLANKNLYPLGMKKKK
ncbi:hypothetical protein RA79_05660 [Listeria monocytogenes]|uniref:hypothetical protein n=1 Tax=Listeria monocytogenes TaxID=1639 RepID=UPI00083D6F2E|nr:hypothetical protein [Listeria monocytogenes]EAF3056552.1 hypothetical protein [Listeria monocytogenes serotype 1/2c]EAC2361292.1 hypothetical protein [Listeria monocytogenes]EAC2493712.1 hypothetical protein [Listeria monocytogenes]EAC2625462.1 hypothetical protein [Listeria monocytogenes]EAC3297455.1 hypothetical protein [Listeria monocytogenes]